LDDLGIFSRDYFFGLFGSLMDVEHDEFPYQKVQVSFQSTRSSCNISTVNALNATAFKPAPKERGMGDNKRRWLVEMNDTRELYLKSYGGVDMIDAAINRMQIGYISWKYWHSPKNHLLGLAVVQAYSFYLEILMAPEALQYFEEAKKALYSMKDFVQHLSTQGLKYDPRRKKFRLDVLLWTVHMTDSRERARRRRARSVDNALGRAPGRPRLENSAEPPGVMSKALYSRALGDLNLGTRLVGDLNTLTQHLKSFDKTHSNAGKKWCKKWCNLAEVLHLLCTLSWHAASPPFLL
jgi:hypothetical protein